ncbi:mercury resistance transcriptional regulator MerR1 [Lysinibacillus fusiformis]|uniref:mercury resistance transcriptional regulator MerR1 n=1 Tax=Lysinibacillus fusiformis TaxID=28031 RepID=UPI000E33285E|nr:mercury resistance transcriptional regulator MerR1 [Lysinibacillus fusiformis]AXQ50906.1 Hg(II)-responsive transcriptional regulator [Stenotrophomonas rhizophila]KAB0447223.1 Hg(II)-responsive transcriptional regulator [Lysinibacillus fusiformis]
MQYRIGELAEKCGVNKETIRYYERLGLIPKPNRTENGYRIYSLQTVDRLNFVKRMQELGFTLNEIGKLLGVVDHNEAKCRDIYDFTVLKLEDIESKIEDLKKIEQMLIDLKDRCPENKNIYECPIIETLMD